MQNKNRVTKLGFAELEKEAVDVSLMVSRLENSLLHLEEVDDRIKPLLKKITEVSRITDDVEWALSELAEEEEEAEG